MWPQPNGSGMPPPYYQAAPMIPWVDEYGQEQLAQLPYQANQMTYPAYYQHQPYQYNQQWPQNPMMAAQQGGMSYAQSQWQFQQANIPQHASNFDTQQSIQSPDAIKPACENCGGTDHSMQFCMKSIDRRGYMTGCPPCNTKLHNYRDPEACKYPYTDHSDLYFVVICRHNRPPLMTRMDFRHIQGFAKGHHRPWTPEFALKMEENGFLTRFKHQVLVMNEQSIPDPTWSDLVAFKAFNEKYPLGTLIHPHYRQQLTTLTARDQAVSATPVQSALVSRNTLLPPAQPLKATQQRRARHFKQQNSQSVGSLADSSSDKNRQSEDAKTKRIAELERQVSVMKETTSKALDFALVGPGRSNLNPNNPISKLIAASKSSLAGESREKPGSLPRFPRMNQTQKRSSFPREQRITRVPERASSSGIRKRRPNNSSKQRKAARAGRQGQTVDELISQTSATFPPPSNS